MALHDVEPVREEPSAPDGVGTLEPAGEVALTDSGTFGGVEAQAAAIGITRQTQFGGIWKRFLRNKLAVIGLGMVVALLVTAALAPWIAPFDPYRQNLANTQAAPSSDHLFGTDDLGRDLLSRVIYGSRTAVIIGLVSIFLSLLVGILLGVLAGYFGRAWDVVIMRLADVFFAFPILIGAIMIILVVGRGVMPLILALAIFGWATPARLLRSSILSVRESEYVEAARSLGASRSRIVRTHILPNSIVPVLVYATVGVGTAVVAAAALSFLGVGVKPDVPEWGNMIANGKAYFGYKNYLWMFPSFAVVFAVLGFVFTGDGLRDALDPRLR